MAGKTVEEIFGNQLKNAKEFDATTMASTILINDGKGILRQKTYHILYNGRRYLHSQLMIIIMMEKQIFLAEEIFMV